MAKAKKGKGRVSAQLTTGKPSGGNKGSVGAVGLSNGAIRNASAISDPFSPNARGAKIPDSNSSRSVPITLRTRTALSTNASGNGSRLVTPGLADHVCAPSAITTTSTTIDIQTNATDISDFAAIAAACDSYRIVSWGIRVFSPLSPLDQHGEVTLITLPDDAVNYFGANVAFSGSLFEGVSRYPMANCDIHWVSKPKGNRWMDYTAVANSFPAYDSVLVVLTGAKATQTQALIIESFINIEAQPTLLSISSLVSTPAADHHPHALAAGNNVHNKHSGAHNGTTQSFSSKLWGFLGDTLSDVASSAIPMVGNTIGRAIKGFMGRKPRQLALPAPVMEVD
jgi:hypothetical protein